LRVLSPFAPHLAEEIWSILSQPGSIAEAAWPAFEESFLKEASHEYPVMINGKLRFKILLPLDLPVGEVEQKVLEHEAAIKWTGGKPPRKVIFVPEKIINIVLG